MKVISLLCAMVYSFVKVAWRREAMVVGEVGRKGRTGLSLYLLLFCLVAKLCLTLL